jgi:cell division septation protein DedD
MRSSALIASAILFGLAGAALAEDVKSWVQIAALPTEAAAASRLAEIGQRNATVRAAREAGRILIYKHVDKRGDIWRVRIGPFDDHEQARLYCGQLRAEGQSCLPVR